MKKIIDIAMSLLGRMFGRKAKSHDKVQLWEGGPYWATTNIGAEKPEDFGYYFWWGDTVGYKRENDKWVASDGATSGFTFSFEEGNAPTYGKRSTSLQNAGWVTADDILEPEYDAAHVKWGDSWRMPTKQEIDDLYKKCEWSWGSMNGVNGCIFRGKGNYASASIFLPCAGSGSESSLQRAGVAGVYWSAVPEFAKEGFVCTSAYALAFRQDLCFKKAVCGGRFLGYSVRPVQDFVK